MRCSFLFLACFFLLPEGFAQQKLMRQEAENVIKRFSGNHKANISLAIIEKQEGRDVFETSVRNGRLTIRGSSGVALCRGFYEYVKSLHAGICSWSGQRCDLPEQFADREVRRVVSPVEHHYYLNVVTFGYSMPYWNWQRWEQEIDWMALHGIDMPLALTAYEAIMTRVWKKLGLTEKEIADYFVGPAHLPWMRMGNISGIDGPLSQDWHTEQVALQHKILGRMRSLGMHPICPAFAGFIPPALKRVYPEVKVTQTSWCGGAFHNWIISPEEKLFAEIGRMFIEEWEKEFGKNDYYLADSFNEMELPFADKMVEEKQALLGLYGERVYQSIQAGNPDAVWVMQGWMFGYQREIWNPATLEALVSRVPDDKMLLLDLAVDYNKLFWKNGTNWEYYKGFFNKPWIYSVIPNMGGKNGMTGVLEFYANGHLEALASAYRGRLAGVGMAPEGIENNEVIYELLTDAGWKSEKTDIDRWLADYTVCRYGIECRQLQHTWKGLMNSVYGGFTDHPRYNWQFRPGLVKKGSIAVNRDFFEAVENFVECATLLKGRFLYRVDLIEFVAAYLGGKGEILIRNIEKAYEAGKQEEAMCMEREFEELMLGMDRLLESHPEYRLERWLDFARIHGKTPEEMDRYERNARRIVTIWGPPVDDYSARIWSGLVRDYYLPRWKLYFESKKTGKKVDFPAWERRWVERTTGCSDRMPYDDVVAAAREWIEKGRLIQAH